MEDKLIHGIEGEQQDSRGGPRIADSEKARTGYRLSAGARQTFGYMGFRIVRGSSWFLDAEYAGPPANRIRSQPEDGMMVTIRLARDTE